MRDGRPFFLLGISRNNLEAAVQGKPIHVDLTELGHHECGAITIVGGETEESIADELKRHLDIPDEAIQDRTKTPKH